LSQFIKQSLSHVGVAVNIETADIAGWGNRISNWETDMSVTYLTTLSDPAIGVARTFITSNQLKGVLFSNTSGYSNPEVDRLFDAAAREPDEAKRIAMYHRLQHMLVDDVALCWLVEPQSPTVYAANLKNVIRNGLGPNDSFAEVHFE
ncbi:MAG: ABC transporter substrate-binding protein, partial [Proteobacteria bacterium]|nr:ABC transporter substrate-binding protein [Pseudomonadota bacterium]